MLCFVVKHLGSSRALKKLLSCSTASSTTLPLPACFTTEHTTVSTSLFVNYNMHSPPLLVVQEDTSALFRRNWLMDIKLPWKNLPGLNHILGLYSPLRLHLRETLHWTLFYSNMMNYFSASSDVTLVSLLC